MTHRTLTSHLRGRVGLSLLVLSTVLALIPAPAQAQVGPFAVGDVFVGVGDGQIARYASTGTLLQHLDTTSGSQEETGLCFDAAGNLYTTNWTRRTMSKFDPTGALLADKWRSFSGHPIDCAVNAIGAIYVAAMETSKNTVQKYDAAGTLLATFAPAPENRDVGALALGSDQCTLFYTSQGQRVKRFDVCTNTQLPDFAILPINPNATPAFGLKVRPNGEVLVATWTAIYRLDPTGAVLQTYSTASVSEPSFFAWVSLDPDGTSFWTAGVKTGNAYKIDLASGAVLTGFTAPPVFTAVGLSVFGAPDALTLPDDQRGAIWEIHTLSAGGTFPRDKVSFEFALSCDADLGSAGLTVMWRSGKNRFDLDTLTSAFCPGDFDSHQGTGTGLVNGVPGATVMWSFGGVSDGYSTPSYAELVIKDAQGRVLLKVAGVPQATLLGAVKR